MVGELLLNEAFQSLTDMTMLYRKSFIFLCVAFLMLLAVLTQSQMLIGSTVGSASSKDKDEQKHSKPVKVAMAMPSTKLTNQPAISHQSILTIGASDIDLLKMQKRLQQRIATDQQDYEAKLLSSIVAFQLGDTQHSIDELNQLSQQAPHFHLAHLVRADFLASRFGPTNNLGNSDLTAENKQIDQQLKALRHEAKMRIIANVEHPDSGMVPLQLLNLSHKVQTALVVDKSRHRLYLFKRESTNAPAKLIRDFYVSTGREPGNKSVEGDLRTPEGIYFITSWIPDNELPEKYGIGAFPTNYPNTLDRKLGKTGDGIWLHGTDRIYYSRPPLDSEGCVVLSNLDLNKIKHLIEPGQTPMVITDKIEWVDEQQWNQVRSQVLKSIERWRQDWESLDVDRYLSHYAKEFWSGGHDIQSWRQYKSRIAKQKTYQKVDLSELSLFYYPQQASDGKPMVVAKFVQKYQSNNYQGEVNKRIYLGKEADRWRILYEGR